MSVQLENGFTKIADELLEIIPFYKFNGTQFSIILIIIRYTYGFSRKDHEISLTFLTNATGISRNQIDRELSSLIDKDVVNVTKEATATTSRKLTLNKHYENWKVDRRYPLIRGQSPKKSIPELEVKVSPNQSTQGIPYLEDKDIQRSFINNKDIYMTNFEIFWTLYPSKKGKSKAITKWMLLSPKMDFEKVIEGTKSYIAFIEHGKANGKNREYKDGATFVNQESWNDEWSISDVRTFRPTNKQQPTSQPVSMTDEERQELRNGRIKQAERNGIKDAVNI